jgi:hypothetical protein
MASTVRCASAISTPGGSDVLAKFLFGRGHENREQAAGKIAFTGLRQIKLALVLTLQKRRDRIPAGAPMQAQQRVVMAVKNRNVRRRGQERFSAAGSPGNG